MGESLTGAEMDAFAAVFGDRDAARMVLDRAGFPAAHVPFAAPTALLFWSSVSRALGDGALRDGRDRLLGAARELYPHNSVFAPRGVREPLRQGTASRGPVVWNLPSRLPRFVGRDDLLAEVHARLSRLSEESRVALVALDGMGGVGKTSLAVEYAYRHAAEFDVVYWVPAERADLVGQHLSGLAGSLGLAAGADAEAVWAALQGVPSWLVLFDNVEDIDTITRFQPSRGGRVLLTSRRRAVRRLGAAVPVPALRRGASVALLRDRVPDLDAAAAGLVAELVGDLPLALDQAAGYLDETDMPVAEYVRLLAGRPESGIAGLWNLSVRRLEAERPAAVELLELCAWCAPDPVPLALFAGRPDSATLGPDHAAVLELDGGDGWADAVGALVGYSLARRDRDLLVVHRLVAAETRRATPPERAAARRARLSALLRDAAPDEVTGDPGGWPVWQVLLPHVLAAAGHPLPGPGPAFDDRCWLVDHAGAYLKEQGQLATAIPLYERNLAEREQLLGRDHPSTLASTNSLAAAFQIVGRVDEAIDLHERTLARRERVLGVEHPDTLISLTNLAGVYRAAGRVDEAVELHERALASLRRVLGADHRSVLAAQGHLAVAYRTAGRLDQAIELHRRTITDRERTLGADHPDTLTSRNNLANAQLVTGHVEQALALYERTLADRERVLGSGHPATLTSRRNLALGYEAAGRTDEAINLLEATLTDCQRLLDTDHPLTATVAGHLAHIRAASGR
ncbi:MULTISPECIES: tetratricopeptide repeat protein [Pseudofrankia]|uniref:tetratricopeptide repeat protein n=1 Tax=Pseudofrankia TaxID=2994363 RepID=UPI000234B97D|nr:MULTISPECIES: tetratricopeptide repeat protein [Pseudofrankia]